ncbi:MAG: pyrroloquinoline quinone-dependent dehydrogenase [Bryobacterales bacterium]|nr:pyrroloquinoline quinone-dependent dehydrogenase [Bryobacterales bacterium]
MKTLYVLLCAVACAQQPAGSEWPHHGGSAAGTRYSPLKQINRGNVTRLRVAWSYKTGDVSDGTVGLRSAFETTPLMVGGVLYLTTPFCRLIALDAETGKERWSFDPKLDREKPFNLFVNRGAAYWSDGRKQRLLYGTLDGRLVSVDARTGKPDPAFGQDGYVDLTRGYLEEFPQSRMGLTSPPAVYKNLVIAGSLVSDGDPRGPAGDLRAFDVRTGKEVWRFHTVPRPGEFGHDTWAADSWKGRGGTNAWSLLSVDSERGMVFVPLTSPSYDYYGGDRKGQNLFGDSIVALDALTGKRIWHFQTVHHNLWDYDLPAQPVLIESHGVPAVAQIAKTGFVFLLNRLTGRPLFPVEERSVPASTVPGEEAWPTQPFPTRPPPFARQSFKAEELTTVTEESRRECRQLIEGAVFGTLFTPLSESPTVLFPGTNGGANWPGPSFDPETHTLFVNSHDNGMLLRMVKRPEGSVVPYRARALSGSDRFWDSNMYPCQQPPWGHLTAIDLERGEFRWRSTLGVFDDLAAKGIPPTGTSNLGGSVVTAGGLVFIGATNDSRFRAFDKESGKELWVTRLTASAHAAPMTYLGQKSGKQFVVIAAGGGNKYNRTFSDELVAFALP